MKTIITAEIKKEMLDALESNAENGIIMDEFLFKLNMDLYPHLRDHLGIENNTTEGNIKVKYMSLDEAKKEIIDNCIFGYQYWDRGDNLSLNSWVDAITEDIENEEESDKLYDIIDAEEKALHTELETQLKKVVNYNFDVKCHLEDLDNLEDLDKKYSELEDYYNEAVTEIEENRQTDLIVHQTKNIKHHLIAAIKGTHIRGINAIKELANDDNFINMSKWGNKESKTKLVNVQLALRLADDFITHLENNSDVEDVLNGFGYDEEEIKTATTIRMNHIQIKDVK